MIVEDKLGYVGLLFRVRGGVLPRIWRRVLLTTLIAAAVTVLEEKVPQFRFNLTPQPFTLIGLPLGIFLGFRNNTSYDRFWEGRRLWGALVNTSRTLARQILMFVHVPHLAPDPTQDNAAHARIVRTTQVALVHRVIAFIHALRMHLRSEDPFETLGRFLEPAEVEALRVEKNVPNAIVAKLGSELQKAWRKEWVHPHHLASLDKSLADLTDFQGGCERIRSTPIPFSYTVLIHQVVALYCLLLPLGFYETTKLATPLVVLFVSYCFFGLDAIGEEIESPFGKDFNDLPLLSISTMIETNLRQRLGETDLPKPIEPIEGDHLI